MRSFSSMRRALAAALPHTLPIMAGFLFLGMTYGVHATASGLPPWIPVLTSLAVFAGSAEFVAVNLLLGAFNPIQALAMTLMINARHLFYGVSLLEKYKGTGLKKLYLIFGMCDESFSINCSARVPEGVDRGQFYFCVTLLDHLYWVTGVTLGSLFGAFVTFNTEGLDFVMTAMFTVILLEQLQKKQSRPAALLGLGLSLIALLAFGADRFLIPAMLAILAVLTLLRRPLERGGDGT